MLASRWVVRIGFHVWAATLLLVPTTIVYGQATARLVGSVADPSGSHVPHATVIGLNVRTGVEYKASTNEDGLFRFPELPIGTYEVSVSSPGFRKLVQKGVELLTSQTVELLLRLELGQVNEAIEVSDATPLVQTAESAVQTSVDVRQMQELPLNGRNPLQLVVLTPGAQMTTLNVTTGQQDNDGVSVNGARATDNNFRLDGGNYTNTWFGSAPVLPNPDTLQEFTVQSSNYSARNSGGGALVELSTRSGSNQLHGTLFEFVRNEKLNASDFVANSRPPFKRNQFGGTVGGPIRRDRTFFFGSYQGTRERSSPSVNVLTPPTGAMRRGDFSEIRNVVVDPLNNTAFPGNRIPTTRLDPITLKIMDAGVPLAGPGVTRQLAVPSDADKNDDQYLIKIDHMITARSQLSARFFDDRYNFQRQNAGVVPGVFGDNVFRNQSVTVRYSNTFTPSLVFTALGTYSRFRRDQFPSTPITVREAGAKYPLGREAGVREGIRFNVAGYFNLFSGGALQQIPQLQDYRFSFFHNRGGHGLQFGSDIAFNNVYHLDVSNSEGQFQFNGRRTRLASISGSGIAMADALLGLPNTFTQNSGKSNRFHESRYHLWINDDWKVGRSLTLNLGLRWEPWLPPEDRDGKDRNRLVGFIPGFRSKVAPLAPVNLVFPGDADFPDSLLRKDWNNLAPRAGFAWDVWRDGRTVLRGGYGIFYKSDQVSLYAKATEVQPFSLLVSRSDAIPSIVNPYSDIAAGSPYPFRAPASLADIRFTPPIAGFVTEPTARSGYMQNWNFAVQRALVKQTVLTVGYVGNHAVKLMSNRQVDPAIYGPGATANNTEQRRLYQGFGDLDLRSPFGFSNYHALQVEVRRRSHKGLTIWGNYVFGKSIDNESNAVTNNGGVRNPLNPNLDRAPADNDLKHMANLTAVYELPRAGFSNAVLWGILNGWQTNGILTLRSGFPQSVLSGFDNSLSANGRDFADVVGNPKRLAGVDPLVKWFNTAAFAQNAIGTFGNAGRNIIRGPSAFTVDVSLFKNFTAHESWKLQVRGEAFNVCNHGNLGDPTMTLSNANFGRILNTSTPPRVMQLALKLMF